VDDTLSDENEEIISDVSYVIGYDALSSFGDGSDDPDIVYVRNEKLQTDYEVTRLNKSYSETVLGVIPEKKPRARRQNVRRREASEE
jgi:hypothetical protein